MAAKPDFTQVHLLRAKLLDDLGRRQDALDAIDKLLAIAPGLAEAWLGRSNILFQAGHYADRLRPRRGDKLNLSGDLAGPRQTASVRGGAPRL